ncbi:MAG TPA: hypothetical protein VHW09_28275 [Bryobacteraceae bacterium]|nr:hypothetical protein [Bryobacteraceae bacterium]
MAVTIRGICGAIALLAGLCPLHAQSHRFLSEWYTGRYRCGGPWREFQFRASPGMGLLGVEDPDAPITAAMTLHFHSANGIEAVGYRLTGSFDQKTGRFHFQPEPWTTRHPAALEALGIEGTFDPATGRVAAKMLSGKCDAVEMVPPGEKLPPLTDASPAPPIPRDPKRPETLPGATNVTNYLDVASYSPDFEYLVPRWYDPPGTVYEGDPIDQVAEIMKKDKFACEGSQRVAWDASGTHGSAADRVGVTERYVIECVGDCKGVFYRPEVGAQVIHFGMTRPLPTLQIKSTFLGGAAIHWKFSRTGGSQPAPAIYVHEWKTLVGFGPMDPGPAEIARRMAEAPPCKAPRDR